MTRSVTATLLLTLAGALVLAAITIGVSLALFKRGYGSGMPMKDVKLAYPKGLGFGSQYALQICGLFIVQTLVLIGSEPMQE